MRCAALMAVAAMATLPHVAHGQSPTASLASSAGAASDTAPKLPPPADSVGASLADPALGERFRAMQLEMDALHDRIRSLEKDSERARQQEIRIAELEAAAGERWLSEERARQVRELVQGVIEDSQSRAASSSRPTAGYDRNFFLSSADGNFSLNLAGQLQSRFAWTHLPAQALTPATEGTGNEYGFEVQSVKLNLFGHAVDPSWQYRVQFAYERDGAQIGTPLRFEDVYVQKSLGDGFYLRTGQWKNFLNYEEIVSSRTQQFVERSVVNQYFSTSFVQGVMLGWESGSLRTFLSYNDGGGNRDVAIIQPSGDLTDWALTGRVEWKPEGAWRLFDEMQGWRGGEAGLMLGAGVNWQRGAGNPAGARGVIGNGQLTPTVSSPAALLTWTADANVRGSGWSVGASLFGNLVYDVNDAAAAAGLDNALSLGTVVQGGMFLSEDVELMARYEGLWVNSGATGFSGGAFTPNALNNQTMNIFTLGLNKYFFQNALKFTIDGGWAVDPVGYNFGLYGQSIAAGDWRPSQSGSGAGEFVIRCQMQVAW